MTKDELKVGMVIEYAGKGYAFDREIIFLGNKKFFYKLVYDNNHENSCGYETLDDWQPKKNKKTITFYEHISQTVDHKELFWKDSISINDEYYTFTGNTKEVEVDE